MWSVFPGFIIQLITIFAYSNFFKKIEKQTVLEFYEKISQNKIPNIVFDIEAFLYVFGYVLLMTAIAFVLAQISWYIVRIFKLDRRITLLRFSNYWHYYFKGEIRDFKDFQGRIKGKVLLVYADILTKNDGNLNILYSGLLTQYTISKATHSLENIYLTDVSRFGNTAKKFKDIPGDCMIIPYLNVININLRYVCEEKKGVNYNSVIGLFFFIGVGLILMDFWFLISDSILKNIIIKIIAILEWVFFLVLIQSFFDKKLKEQKLTVPIFIMILILSFIIFLIIKFDWVASLIRSLFSAIINLF